MFEISDWLDKILLYEKNCNTPGEDTHLHVDEELDDAPQTDENAFKKVQVEV